LVIVPKSFHATHQTAGLPGYPAVDIFAPPGTPVTLAEAGNLTRVSGHDPRLPPPLGQGGPWGLSVYCCGKSGNVYYLTHLAKVRHGGPFPAGAVVGVIGDYPGNAPGADHVHVGLHQGDSPEAHYPSITVPAGCWLPASTPEPKPKRRLKLLPGPVPKPAWFFPAVKQFLTNRKRAA
jgi:hypothetical protein